MSKTLHLFPLPKKKRRVIMHFIDAGVSPYLNGDLCAEFECKKCGHKSGWQHGFKNVTEIKRGIPCPECNKRLIT